MLTACLLAAAWTWPAVLSLDDIVLISGSSPPAALSIRAGYAHSVSAEVASPTVAGLLTLPYRLGNYSFAETFVFSPVSILLPFPRGFNVLVLLVQIGNFMAFFALFRHLSRSAPAALVAAAFATWNPFTVAYIDNGHLDVLTVAPLAMYFLGLMRWLEGRSRGALVGGLAWLGLCGLIYWFWIYMALLGTALLLGAEWARGRLAWRDVSMRFLPALLFCLLCLAPFAVGIMIQSELSMSNRPREPGRPFPALASVLTPSADYYGDYRIVREAVPMGNIVRDYSPLALVLGLCLLPWARGARWRWLVMFGVFLLLSWGPYPRWDVLRLPGEETRSAVYCLLYQYLPGFSRLHFPERFLAPAVLALGVLMAGNLAALMSRCRLAPGVAHAVALTLVVGSLLVASGRQELPYTALSLSKLSAASCSTLPDTQAAVLQLPFGTGVFNISDWAGVYQLLRGQSVRTDWMPRSYLFPPYREVLPASNRFLRDLARLHDRSEPLMAPSVQDIEQLRRDFHLGYVALDRSLFLYEDPHWGGVRFDSAVACLRDFLGEPVIQDAGGAVFVLSASAGPRLQASHSSP